MTDSFNICVYSPYGDERGGGMIGAHVAPRMDLLKRRTLEEQVVLCNAKTKCVQVVLQKDYTTLHTDDLVLATESDRFTSRILIDTCLGGPEQVSISGPKVKRRETAPVTGLYAGQFSSYLPAIPFDIC
jgi:hypothetical protein